MLGLRRVESCCSPCRVSADPLSVYGSVDPMTLKEWYDIKAPSIFQVRNPGKTLVTRTKGTSESLSGRFVLWVGLRIYRRVTPLLFCGRECHKQSKWHIVLLAAAAAAAAAGYLATTLVLKGLKNHHVEGGSFTVFMLPRPWCTTFPVGKSLPLCHSSPASAPHR